MGRTAIAVTTVLILWCAGLGASAQFAKIAVPFAEIRALYPGAGASVGWLLSLVSLMGAFLGVVAGGVVSRLGAKRVLLWGLALGGAASLWQASLPAFAPMILSRVIEGVSHLAIVVSAPTLVVLMSSPRHRGLAMTLWSTFFGVSFAIYAWFIIPFALPYGMANLFLGHAVFMAFVALVLAVLLPPDAASAIDQKPSFSQAHRRAYGSPWISAPGAGWLLYTLTFVSLLALFPDTLPVAQVEWVLGTMPLVSIAVSLLIVPVLLTQMKSIRVVQLGFLLAAVLVAVNVLQSIGWVFPVGLFAILGLVQGASFTAVPELNTKQEDQALAYGLMAQSGNIGNLLGTPVLLAIAGVAGPIGMFSAVAALYVVGIVVHEGLNRKRISLA